MADSLADLFVSFKAVERPKRASKSSIWKSNSRSGSYSGWGDDDIFASLYDDDIYSRVINNPYYVYPFYSSPSVTENTGEEAKESYMGTSYNYGGLGIYAISESTLGAITDQRLRANKLKSDITRLFKKAGISEDEYEITSGFRQPGAAGNAGENSWHTKGYALDITVKNGTYDAFVKKLVKDKDIRNYFINEGLGILDEWNSMTRQQTGATGPHIHIGPDQAARSWLTEFMQNNGITQARYGGKVFRARNGVKLSKEENAINHWSNRMYDAFRKAIKEKYGKRCPGDRADKLALYMTAQAAITSNYGDAKNNNYGNLRKENGDTATFESMKEFAKAQVNTLDTWNIVSAETLREYVDKLFFNEDGMVYDASEYPEVMYRKMEATAKEINNAIGLSMKVGGSLERIRQLHADTEKFFKGGSVRKYAISGEIEAEKDEPDDPNTGKKDSEEQRIIDMPLSEMIAYYAENSTDVSGPVENEEVEKENWTKRYFATLLEAYKQVRDGLDINLSDDDIKNLAFWGLLQGCLESGWGINIGAREHNNYSGMLLKPGQKIHYDNMFDGCVDRFRNLCSKFPDAIEANNFWEYIKGLYNIDATNEQKGPMYCTDKTVQKYGNDIAGCYKRAIGYLGMEEGDFEKPLNYKDNEEKIKQKNWTDRQGMFEGMEYVIPYYTIGKDGERELGMGMLPEVNIRQPKYDSDYNINVALGYHRTNDGHVTFKFPWLDKD